jgi:hypothetical protein
VSDLLEELMAAERNALAPCVQQALESCGMFSRRGPILGIAPVSVTDRLYVPDTAGSWAIIVPAFVETEAGQKLFDLVAVVLSTRLAATRRGLARLLGTEWIDLALAYDRPVPVYLDPCRWLTSGRRGVLLIEPEVAPHGFEEVPAVACSKQSATALRDALAGASTAPDIFIAEKVAR